jgi:hypothetical protein
MRFYMKFRQTDAPIAAAKASISRAAAFRFERDRPLPSRQETPRGRRRPDPLGDIFAAEVVPVVILGGALVACIRPDIRDPIERLGRFALDMAELPALLNPQPLPFGNAL